MAGILKLIYLGLLASQCLAAAIDPRTVMHNSGQTMQAFRDLKPGEKPMLIGPGGGFKDSDLEELAKFGGKKVGAFSVTSKLGHQAPVGTKLPHHIFVFYPSADILEATKYMLKHKINFFFQFNIPKSNEIAITFGPENVEAAQKLSQPKVRWIKAEDTIAGASDQGGPTDAFTALVKSQEATLKTITSAYTPPGWLRSNADDVIEKLEAWEKRGWYIQGSSRERLSLYSPAPDADNTWLGSFKNVLTGNTQASWLRTGLEVFEEVKRDFPLYGPEKVPMQDVDNNVDD